MSRRRRLAYARAQAARAAAIAEARRPGLVYYTRRWVAEVVHKWFCWLIGKDMVMVRSDEIEVEE